jgi:hypothetical protein
MKWKRKHKDKLLESEGLIYAKLSIEELYKLQEKFNESGEIPEPGCSSAEEQEYLFDEAMKQIEEVIHRTKLKDKFSISKKAVKGIPLNKGPVRFFIKTGSSSFPLYCREREEFQYRIDKIVSFIEDYSEDNESNHPCRRCEYTFITTGVKQRSGKVIETYLYCLNCGAAYTYYTEPPEYPEGMDSVKGDPHYISMIRPCFDSDVIIDENW